MIQCDTCGAMTPESRNFCQSCRHKIRDLKTVRLGPGTRTFRSVEYFWETGDPSVFAQPGSLDYNPGLPR